MFFYIKLTASQCVDKSVTLDVHGKVVRLTAKVNSLYLLKNTQIGLGTNTTSYSKRTSEYFCLDEACHSPPSSV